MKGTDAFERSMKDALEAYEVPYNSADWAQLERKLDSGKSSNWQNSAGLYALFLGGSVAIFTTMYVLLSNNTGGNGPDAIALVMEANDHNDHRAAADTHAQFTLKNIDVITTEDLASDTNPSVTASDIGEAEPRNTTTRTTSENTTTAKSSSTPAKADRTPTARTPQEIAGGAGVDESAVEAPKGVAIRPSVTEGCPGTTVDFSVENMPEDGIHLWNFGDGNFSNKATPTHTFSKAGTFEVMLSHSSIGGGNIRNKPAADRIVIHEAPEASFHFRKDEFDNTVPSVRFDNRSIGGNQYHWDFGDGSISTVAHPNHVFKKKGSYQVTLTTTNAKGCVDRSERTVVINNDYNLLAPRTFSPDGNGIEDSFLPEALKTLGVKFNMSIFDSTTGALIYETTDPQRPWNGRIGNKGELCSPGDYVWLVEMKDGDLLGGTYTGNVGLLR